MQTERATSDDEVGRPWKRIAWAVVILVIVLTYALNAMTRDAANKAAIERVRKAEEYMTNGPPKAPPQAQAEKPFSAEEAEREMSERERAVREKFESEMNRRDDDNRRKMERANRDFEAQRRREAAELRARQNSRIP